MWFVGSIFGSQTYFEPTVFTSKLMFRRPQSSLSGESAYDGGDFKRHIRIVLAGSLRNNELFSPEKVPLATGAGTL